MRECWINVYPGFADDMNPTAILGSVCAFPEHANEAAIGEEMCRCGVKRLAERLRAAGVGYRLHVRLKVPALPDSDGDHHGAS